MGRTAIRLTPSSGARPRRCSSDRPVNRCSITTSPRAASSRFSISRICWFAAVPVSRGTAMAASSAP
ncbi:MAG: hypothetical protein DMD42_05185 [Gemmatimonadetes bacterium]|nr:MAG: hypothetical protein DMD42_05185 [Gemmatimonadota bacterium]